MSRPYSPRAVLRHLPPDLIREFAGRAKIPMDLDHAVAAGDAAPVFDAWLALAAGDRARVEEMLRHVHELATPDGVRVLIEEALFAGHDVAEVIGTLDGHHARALWALLAYPDVFRTARAVVHSANLPARYWRKRAGFPRQAPDLSHDARVGLQAALSDFYRREQGRGQRVTVEHYARQGRVHYAFAYPDDYASTYVGHDDHGRLQRRPQRPAFEVVYVYDPDAGTLDLYAQGGRHVREFLEDAFCAHALGCEPVPPVARPPYELASLLDPGFRLPHDPDDGVVEVRVRKLRVSVPGSGRRMTLEADPGGPPDDIHAMIDEWVNAARVPRPLMRVTQATLTITYRPAEGGRERPLTFTVSSPDSCDLKGKPEEQRALGEKYLRRWGIARD